MRNSECACLPCTILGSGPAAGRNCRINLSPLSFEALTGIQLPNYLITNNLPLVLSYSIFILPETFV
jgi:hypothetical protein